MRDFGKMINVESIEHIIMVKSFSSISGHNDIRHEIYSFEYYLIVYNSSSRHCCPNTLHGIHQLL